MVRLFYIALHLCFGFGGTIAPLISKPFLLPRLYCSENGTTTAGTNCTAGVELTYPPDAVQITWTYFMMSAILIVSAAFSLFLFIFHRETPRHPSRDVIERTDSKAPVLNQRVKTSIVTLTSAFMFIYFGLEIAMGSLLTTFAEKSNLGMTKLDGADLTFVYWLTFSFFRVFAVFYIEYIGSEYNLYFDLLIIMVANVFLVPFGNTYRWCLWTGVPLIGIGMSSVWASVFGFLEEKYFPVTTKMTAAFTMSSCIGEFVFPFLMGK